jgi:hypothetical protein
LKTPSLTLAAPPEMSFEAAEYGRVAHLAYQFDGRGRLIRTQMPQVKPNAIMALCHSGRDLPDIDRKALLNQFLREIGARKYSAVLADIEGSASEEMRSLLRFLAAELEQRRIPLWVPETCAEDMPDTVRVIISSAISGGSYTERLKSAAGKWGLGRLILEAERNCEDFLLPSPDGIGRRLSFRQLDNMFIKKMPSPFFSPDLCTYYFTYRDENRRPHFVLFDNANSMRRKLSAAAELGIRDAVLLYPEVRDIIADILAQ